MIGGIMMSNTYTTEKQNVFETILQYFGRFFHSPLYFDTQLPYFGTILIDITGEGSFSILEDNADVNTGTTINIFNDITSSYFSLELEVGKILNLYSVYVSPSTLIDDNTQYHFIPCVEDSSIFIRAYTTVGSTYETWNSLLLEHPFVEDHTFYISFYGKRS